MLNHKQHYGYVYGHRHALFEQGGKLFDGAGREIDESGVALESDDALSEEAIEFVKTMLEAGQVSRSVVAKEADKANLSWHLVQNAANLLNVNVFKLKNTEFWKMQDA